MCRVIIFVTGAQQCWLHSCMKELTIGLYSQKKKNFLLLWNWVHIIPTFLKLFSEHFFSSNIWLIGPIKVKTLLLLDFSFFHQLYWMKHLKYLRTTKYSLERKCEWNLSLVWLFLAIVTFYVNCLDRLVLAHPFRALATFPVCFSVLSCWTIRAPSVCTKWSSWFWKKHICKKQHMCWMVIILSVGLPWTKRKIGKIVTLYQWELFRKIPCLGTSPGYILYPVSKRWVTRELK